MCGQIIIENGEMLKFNSEFCKNKMCDKAVDNYSHALYFVSSCNNTQET